MLNLIRLGLQIAGQLHPHEEPSREEGHQDEDEAHGSQEQAIEIRLAWCVGLVHYDEAQAADREEEAAGQPLHYILGVYSVGHEGHGTRVSVLVDSGAHAGRFHDHIIDDA